MRWDSRQLEALAAVITEGSFEAAAHTLHVTPSAVSQRVRALENAAGSVLVRRTRPVAPTEPGRTLLRLARQVELLGAEASRSLGPRATDDGQDEDGPRGAPRPVTVPLAVNADSLATWVMSALAGVEGVCFDLYREDQDRTVDLLPAGVVMAAITSQREPVQGCSSAPLGITRYRPAATPAVIARWFPDGPSVDALDRAPMVVFNRADDLQDAWLRERAAAAGAAVPDPPRHHVPSTSEYLDAVRRGLGWGMWGPLPGPGARFPLLGDALASGEVRTLADDAVVDVPVYLQQWKLRSDVLDRVTGALRAEARRTLPQR